MLAEHSKIHHGFGEGVGVAEGISLLPPDTSRTGEPLSPSLVLSLEGGCGSLPEPLPRLDLTQRCRFLPGPSVGASGGMIMSTGATVTLTGAADMGC